MAADEDNDKVEAHQNNFLQDIGVGKNIFPPPGVKAVPKMHIEYDYETGDPKPIRWKWFYDIDEVFTQKKFKCDDCGERIMGEIHQVKFWVLCSNCLFECENCKVKMPISYAHTKEECARESMKKEE